MKILAVHDGHNATACYLMDGKVVSMVSEERFTNKKNQGGFPRKSVEWILRTQNMRWEDVDQIVFPHLVALIEYGNDKESSFIRNAYGFLTQFLPRRLMASTRLLRLYFRFIGYPLRRRQLSQYAIEFGFDLGRVRQVEHHTAHAYSAIYGSGYQAQHENLLVFTCDASGDGLSSTVGIWAQGGGYSRILESHSFDSAGTLYAAVTKFLGMRPNEHEYKIMGMAPYVDDEHAQGCFDKFRTYVDFDNKTGRFKNLRGFGSSQLADLRDDFYLERFDSICAGLQKHFEYLILKWVRFWAERTGLRLAVFGGGSFMNVKANMLVAKLDCFEKVFFCPSSGDESTALGAAYYAAEKSGESNIMGLSTLYLGNSFGEDEIRAALEHNAHLVGFEKIDDIEKKTAELLAEGMIVGRFSDAAEWGARSLGNRSILCRADNLRIVNRLNKSIKMRDFWMPFACSILEEDADKYFLNPKKLESSFMIVTFDTLEPAQDDIIAGLHPFDFTCRPQTVSKKIAPSYYQLLSGFKKITGKSGILNTSFNLHGFPIVGTPELAINTLLRSQLDYVALGNFLVWVRPDKRVGC